MPSSSRGRSGKRFSSALAVLRHLIAVARQGMAMREHPKFYLIRVLDLVRDVVRDAGKALGVGDEIFLFRFDEIAAALAGGPKPDLVERAATLRRDAHKAPPLMMASDGEIPILSAREGLPSGALAGTAASAGVVEGIAHVIHDPATEVLAAGEILVAPHTDPGWTPLFVHAAGLVTEVGGLITHGSVVAREYGIPAVVSVASATTRIRSGQRIRVDGTRGFVQILEDSAGKGVTE
jgi:phosphohistidine swiveling domain-containing protein